MRIVAVEQNSQEWRQARLGHATASRVADIVAKTKTGWGASRSNYAGELIAERLTGVPAEKFTNGAMQWGIEHESDARNAYEMRTETLVTRIGFVLHPSIEMSGASPDGLIGDDGLIEIKAPNTATHIETLLSRAIPSKYITQMQFQMACTERSWCDFVSHDSRMPEHLQLFIKRVARDDDMIAALETAVTVFLVELAEKLDQLRNLSQ